MNPIRLVGHVLLWCGFLGGSFATVQHVELAHDKWNTIQWSLYAMALAVGIVGVIILRVTQKQTATHSDKLDSDIKVLEVSVRDLLNRLSELIKNRQQTDVFAVHKLIDSRLMESIGDFVESREAAIHSFGLGQYAELMTDFSVAERNINRAWSASADGYIDEVWASLDRAENKLQAVDKNLTEYKKLFGQ